MKNVLVTGGAGFIGSNFINHLLSKRDDLKIINLDSLTYAGNLENLKQSEVHPNYIFEKIDITNRESINNVFEKYNIDNVINFAAESHVDNSITNPDTFIRTNIFGTFNLIDVARNYWMDASAWCGSQSALSRRLHRAGSSPAPP